MASHPDGVGALVEALGKYRPLSAEILDALGGLSPEAQPDSVAGGRARMVDLQPSGYGGGLALLLAALSSLSCAVKSHAYRHPDYRDRYRPG